MKTFEQAWEEKKAAGYRYGSDALEQVRFGYEIAQKQMVEALRRDWAFLVLKEWSLQYRSSYSVNPNVLLVVLRPANTAGGPTWREYSGDSIELAILSAAKAVFLELYQEKRSEIGECP